MQRPSPGPRTLFRWSWKYRCKRCTLYDDDDPYLNLAQKIPARSRRSERRINMLTLGNFPGARFVVHGE